MFRTRMLTAVLLTTAEAGLSEFTEKLLEDMEGDMVLPVIRERRKSEKNEFVLELMDLFEERIRESYRSVR